LGLAGGRGHPLVNLLDQTGQGFARLADEDQSDQVMVASDGAVRIADVRPGHELRDEPAAIVPGTDLGAGFQRVFCQHSSGEQQGGESGTGHETGDHEKIPRWSSGAGSQTSARALPRVVSISALALFRKREPRQEDDKGF